MIKALAEDDRKIKNIVYAFTYFESYVNGSIDTFFIYNIEY